MLNDLEIVNAALGRLGCERIASLSDNNKRAKLASDFLEVSRKTTLEMGHWDFACKRVILTSTGTPLFEWEYEFDLPVDHIKIIEEYEKEEYKVEGSKILANAEELKLKYLYEIDEDVRTSPSFDKAWYLVLASDLAYTLTQNNSLQSSLLAEAELVVSRAMSLNSQGSSPRSYEFNAFIEPRL